MSISVIEAIRARRSVKAFVDRPVDQGTLESLLELAVLAPNHRMTEPWRFVILSPEARRAYGGIKGERRAHAVEDVEVAETVRRNTVESMESLPAMVAFTQRLDEDPEVCEEDFAAVYMWVHNFLLGALAMGLGTHVNTGAILDEPATRKVLGVEKGERVVALVQVGTPASVPSPKRRGRAAEQVRRLP